MKILISIALIVFATSAIADEVVKPSKQDLYLAETCFHKAKTVETARENRSYYYQVGHTYGKSGWVWSNTVWIDILVPHYEPWGDKINVRFTCRFKKPTYELTEILSKDERIWPLTTSDPADNTIIYTWKEIK